jgi:beta-lactamase class A
MRAEGPSPWESNVVTDARAKRASRERFPLFCYYSPMRRLPKHSPLLLAGLLLFLLGAGAGWLLNERGVAGYNSFREFSSEYDFIAPLLFVEIAEEEAFPAYGPLKQAVNAYVSKVKSGEKVEEMAVYYRNLNTSQWVGVNAEEKFSPASMLKVALLLAILRMSEDDPTLLSRKVVANGVEEIVKQQQDYPPAHPMVSGRTYSVRELLEKLIIDSDNAANQTLYKVAEDARVMRVYDDLKMHRPAEYDPGYSAAEYSRLFRTLYNGTYLSRAQSEYALTLLSKAAFTAGMVAGVPEGTTVSHKFGIRTIINKNDTHSRELHDCGIVYYPEHPYFLCVMTRGSDLPTLENVIAEASRIAWQEVSKVK